MGNPLPAWNMRITHRRCDPPRRAVEALCARLPPSCERMDPSAGTALDPGRRAHRHTLGPGGRGRPPGVPQGRTAAERARVPAHSRAGHTAGPTRGRARPATADRVRPRRPGSTRHSRYSRYSRTRARSGRCARGQQTVAYARVAASPGSPPHSAGSRRAGGPGRGRGRVHPRTGRGAAPSGPVRHRNNGANPARAGSRWR